MKKYTLLLAIIFSVQTIASDFNRHVILPGMVLQEGTLEPLESADIEVWFNDSLILKYESDELGLFQILLSRVDTYDIIVKMGGFHTQHHMGLIIESLKPESSLDIYMTSVKEEPTDIHCGERCWCVNYEKHDWEKDTLGVIQGKIVAKENGEPLPFVNIIIKAKGLIIRTGQTDFDGNFKIDSIPTDSCQFQCSYIGFRAISINKIPVKSAEKWNVEVKLEDYSNYTYFGCGSCCRVRYIPWAGPTIDLFAEEQELDEEMEAGLTSTKFEESLMKPSLSAFPNPIIDLVTIIEIPEIDQFKIINHMGMEMLTVQTDFQKTMTLDVSFLKRGLYFIKYESEGKAKLFGLVKN